MRAQLGVIPFISYTSHKHCVLEAGDLPLTAARWLTRSRWVPCAQGLECSPQLPLLSNLYMHALDEHVDSTVRCCRAAAK